LFFKRLFEARAAFLAPAGSGATPLEKVGAGRIRKRIIQKNGYHMSRFRLIQPFEFQMSV